MVSCEKIGVNKMDWFRVKKIGVNKIDSDWFQVLRFNFRSEEELVEPWNPTHIVVVDSAARHHDC